MRDDDNAMLSDRATDRAVGALLGLACGDAVGTTLEFEEPGTFTPIDDMVGGGPFDLNAGEWTDDTSMALCLAESIVDTGGLDPSDQLRRYVLWQTEGYLSSNGRCFDIGNATRGQLARFRRTGEPFDPNPDPEAAANGSLMRLAPVAIRWHRDPAEAAERAAESSRTTHPAERPVDACRVLGAMTSALIASAPAEHVFSDAFWKFGPLHPEVDAVARGSWRTTELPPSKGYCVHSLEVALWAVAGAFNFRDAILRAANLGGDADTNAAIAGQLAGARWGVSGIPAAWRKRTVMSERIASLALRLYGRAGSPTPQWPLDEFIHAWWVEPGAVLAGEYPGDREPRRAADKIHTLVDAGVRTFIDLTTAADPLEPYDHLVTAASEARQLDVRRYSFPIVDLGVTTPVVYDEITRSIRNEQARGAVYVHCWGGVGRTGTVVGHLLVDSGASYSDVMEALRDLRRGTCKAERPCPETEEQRAVLKQRCSRT